MSFKCTGCTEVVGPNVRPIKRVLETRPKIYKKKVFDKKKRKKIEIVVGKGYETVREGQFCKPCDPQPEAA